MNEILGQTIKAERKSHSLSQKELGELAGTGLNFVSQLERGKPTVRLDKLFSVMKVLGLEFLIGRGKNLISVSPELQINIQMAIKPKKRKA